MTGTSTTPHSGDFGFVHDRLVADGTLLPLGTDPEEQQAWDDHVLASLAERRLGERADPWALASRTRARWIELATAPSNHPFQPRNQFEAPYWILVDGIRIGTLALGRPPILLGRSDVPASSLYVHEAHRGRGHARRVLTSLRDRLGEAELGLTFTTHWTWPDAVGLYLHLGMWIWSWKHDLRFCWNVRDPVPEFEEDEHGETARLSARIGSARVPLVDAARDGDSLTLQEHPAARSMDGPTVLWVAALSTLSVHLASRGWPLIRSPRHLEECRLSDAGFPESLAEKIQVWEAYDREHGWKVETPRLPGLAYPPWSHYR